MITAKKKLIAQATLVLANNHASDVFSDLYGRGLPGSRGRGLLGGRGGRHEDVVLLVAALQEPNNFSGQSPHYPSTTSV
jgi:hypothetical protein